MPTISSMELPIPKNWQDFESIVCDAQAQRWKSTALQKNGRPGQKQNGVDIYGPDDIGRPVGIQCKRYKAPLTIDAVEAEVTKAESFKGQLTTLYIATTADYDATLQQRVRLLSDKRVSTGKFAVAMLFWDDIVGGLLMNPAVFRAHYPQVVLDAPQTMDKERLIAALELGYFGSDLWEYVILIYGEAGWMAQADPDELIATLRVLERRAQQLLSPDDGAPILESLDHVRQGCEAPKNKKSDWDSTELHAKRVSSRLRKAASLLPLAESNVLDLALQLGRIYHHSNNLPAAKTRNDIETKVRSILPANSEDSIKLSVVETFGAGLAWR